MRKLILILLICLMGCCEEKEFNYCITDYTFEHPEQFQNREQIYQWMIDHHVYLEESGNNWQTPAETYTLMTGDCEDWIILLMYFLWEIDIDSQSVRVYDTIHKEYHVIIKVDDQYLEYSGNPIQFMFDNGTYVVDYELPYCLTIGCAIHY